MTIRLEIDLTDWVVPFGFAWDGPKQSGDLKWFVFGVLCFYIYFEER